MKKTLLIISGGVEAIPAILLAKEMGYFTVVSDVDPKAPGFKFADDAILASTYDPLATVKAVNRYNLAIRPINGVMCMAADVPHTVAHVAAALKLPGLPIEVAELAVDKLAMKQKFSQCGIKIPQFSSVQNVEDIQRAFRLIGNHLVIKPVDSRGSRGVIRISPESDLQAVYLESLQYSVSNRVMVEQYLTGPQVSTESIIINGKAFTPGFSDRNYELLEHYAPYFVENGGSLPSVLQKNTLANIHELIQNITTCLGITNGVIKGDVVIHNNTAYIIEIAARLSGGFFSSHEIPLSTGVSTIAAVIKMAMGEKIDPQDLVPKYQKSVVQRYVFPKPGRVIAISGVERANSLPGVTDVVVTTQLGKIIETPKDCSGRCVMVIASGENLDVATKYAEAAVEVINVSTA